MKVDEEGNVVSYLLNDGFARSQGYRSKMDMVRVCFTRGSITELMRKNIWLKPTQKEGSSLMEKFQELYNRTKKE